MEKRSLIIKNNQIYFHLQHELHNREKEGKYIYTANVFDLKKA